MKTENEEEEEEVKREGRVPEPRGGRGLTGDGGVEGEGLQAGQLLAPGLLHAVAEDALPGVQLEQLDAPQQLVGLLQALAGVFLPAAGAVRGR